MNFEEKAALIKKFVASAGLLIQRVKADQGADRETQIMTNAAESVLKELVDAGLVPQEIMALIENIGSMNIKQMITFTESATGELYEEEDKSPWDR